MQLDNVVYPIINFASSLVTLEPTEFHEDGGPKSGNIYIVGQSNEGINLDLQLVVVQLDGVVYPFINFASSLVTLEPTEFHEDGGPKAGNIGMFISESGKVSYFLRIPSRVSGSNQYIESDSSAIIFGDKSEVDLFLSALSTDTINNYLLNKSKKENLFN